MYNHAHDCNRVRVGSIQLKSSVTKHVFLIQPSYTSAVDIYGAVNMVNSTPGLPSPLLGAKYPLNFAWLGWHHRSQHDAGPSAACSTGLPPASAASAPVAYQTRVLLIRARHLLQQRIGRGPGTNHQYESFITESM